MKDSKSGKTVRCPWCLGSPAYVAYHDTEWGVPVHDDHVLFEFLVLEGAQAGLAWSTILNKRDGYRAAFEGFDPERVARFTPRRIERLVHNPRIVRHRQKIEAAVSNARCFLALQEEFGSFDAYLWRFVPGRAPVQGRYAEMSGVPARTEISDRLSGDLRRRGFKFVGSTITYAYMQAVGIVNDHLTGCYRHAECARLGRAPAG